MSLSDYKIFKEAVQALKDQERLVRTEADKNITGLNLEFTGLKSQSDITLGGKSNITNILLIEISKKLDILIERQSSQSIISPSSGQIISYIKPSSKTWRRKQ